MMEFLATPPYQLSALLDASLATSPASPRFAAQFL